MKMTDSGQGLAMKRSGARCRVLVVDDEPSVRATMEAILSEAFDVTLASNGEEAIALLHSASFDVVCTDYTLGGTANGLDVLARAGTVSEHVGRVLITGQREIGDTVGYYVLVKPCDPERMVDVIERAGAQSVARRRTAAATVDPKRRTGDLDRSVITPRQRGALGSTALAPSPESTERSTTNGSGVRPKR